MGITVLSVDVGHPDRPDQTERLDFLVDSGATYSVVPASVLARFGIKSHSGREFRLADGTKITRKIGYAFFRHGERSGVADVIVGEPGDQQLLGALTLEALGLALDPLKREVHPLPILM